MDWLGWLRRIVAVLLSTLSLLAGWRWSMSGMMASHMGPGDPPWAEGRSWSDVTAATPLPAGAWVTIIVVAVGVALLPSRPRTGYGIAAAGLIGYGALGGPGPAMLIPGAIAAAGLILRIGLARGWPWLFAIPVAVWSTSWSEPWLGLADPDTWSRITAVSLWLLAPALIVTIIRGRRRALEQGREAELRQVASAKRLRVVRDIHDVVGHSLSMISLQSGVALRVLDSDPAQARASLEAIRSSSREALAEVRETLGVLRSEDESTPLAPTPDLAAIPRLVEEIRAGGVTVALDPLPSPTGIGPGTQAVAYRVVQEGLTNALRHAPGSSVHVTAHRSPHALTVIVADDAPTPGPIVEGGGLTGMRQRVEALAGTLTTTGSAAGFVVTATLPIDPERPTP